MGARDFSDKKATETTIFSGRRLRICRGELEAGEAELLSPSWDIAHLESMEPFVAISGGRFLASTLSSCCCLSRRKLENYCWIRLNCHPDLPLKESFHPPVNCREVFSKATAVG